MKTASQYCEHQKNDQENTDMKGVPMNLNEEIEVVKEEKATGEDVLKTSRVIIGEMTERLDSMRTALVGRSDRNTLRILREIESTKQNNEMLLNNSINLLIMDTKQPHKGDFKFPKRAAMLRAEALVRFKGSQFMFPDPSSVSNAFISLLPAGANIPEMELRIAHFMAKINLREHGSLVSSICRRLIQAAATQQLLNANPDLALPEDKMDLLAGARGAVSAFVNRVK